MSTNAGLSDGQWLKIRAFLRTHPRTYVGKEANCRLFVEAIHWIMCNRAQWRFLPREYGYWNSVYKRFARWCDYGVWEEMHQHFADDPDMQNLIFNSGHTIHNANFQMGRTNYTYQFTPDSLTM